MYVWSPGERVPGQHDHVWRSEDESGDSDTGSEAAPPETRAAPETRGGRLPVLIDRTSAVNILR